MYNVHVLHNVVHTCVHVLHNVVHVLRECLNGCERRFITSAWLSFLDSFLRIFMSLRSALVSVVSISLEPLSGSWISGAGNSSVSLFLSLSSFFSPRRAGCYKMFVFYQKTHFSNTTVRRRTWFWVLSLFLLFLLLVLSSGRAGSGGGWLLVATLARRGHLLRG